MIKHLKVLAVDFIYLLIFFYLAFVSAMIYVLGDFGQLNPMNWEPFTRAIHLLLSIACLAPLGLFRDVAK